MARSRYKIFENTEAYFLTCTIVGWIPLFFNPGILKIALDSIQYLTKLNRWRLYAYVIMENHLHLVASSEHLSKEVGDFKSFTARSIVDYLKEQNDVHILKQLEHLKLRHKKESTYQVWQEGSHPQAIHDDKMMSQKIEYIHLNPVRRGYVDEPAQWRYSSARNYAGEKGLIDVITNW